MMWSLFQELNLEGPQNWNFNVDFDFIWMILIDDHISSTSASVTIVFRKNNNEKLHLCETEKVPVFQNPSPFCRRPQATLAGSAITPFRPLPFRSFPEPVFEVLNIGAGRPTFEVLSNLCIAHQTFFIALITARPWITITTMAFVKVVAERIYWFY